MGSIIRSTRARTGRLSDGIAACARHLGGGAAAFHDLWSPPMAAACTFSTTLRPWSRCNAALGRCRSSCSSRETPIASCAARMPCSTSRSKRYRRTPFSSRSWTRRVVCASSKPKRMLVVGINRVDWDLRHDSPRVVALEHRRPTTLMSGRSRAFATVIRGRSRTGAPSLAKSGPIAAPGAYSVRLTVDGQTFTQPLTIVSDPHAPGSAADIELSVKTLLKIRDDINRVADSSTKSNGCASRSRFQGNAAARAKSGQAKAADGGGRR